MMDFSSIHDLINEGRFNDALSEIRGKIADGGKDINDWKLMEGICLIKMGKYFDTVEHLQSLLTSPLTQIQKIVYHVLLSESHMRLGKADKGTDHIQLAKDLGAEDDNSTKYLFLKSKALLHWFRGDLDFSLEYAKDLLEVLENKDLSNLIYNDPTSDLSFTLNLLGIIYMRKGDFDKALDFLQRSLETGVLDRQRQAIALVNIGAVYLQQGELDRSLEKYQPGLEMFRELGNQRHLSDTLRSIGQIYHRKGDLQLSLDYLEKSRTIREQLGNKLEYGESLFWFVVVSLDANKVPDAEKAFDALKELSVEIDNRVLRHRSELAHALILRRKKRVRHIGRSMNILRGIIEDEVIDHELTVLALVNYFELLIWELKIIAGQGTLGEINYIAEKLQAIARRQNSFYLLSETYWLQAQLALLQLDLEAAKHYLGMAQEIAEEKKLERLSWKISFEYDKFISEYAKYADLATKNASLIERIEKISPEIEESLEQIRVRAELQAPDEIEETPARLILLSPSNGATFYSRTFAHGRENMQEGMSMDEMLMGSFLTAIRRFTGEVFSRKLERIMVEEYTLLISTDQDPACMVCYIYKGQSYYPVQKVRKFLDEVKGFEELRVRINDFSQKGLVPDGSYIMMLDQLVNTIFLER